VLVLLGLGMMIPRVEALLEKPFARIPRRGVSRDRGGFVLGLALGAVYVPCAGPVLAAITVAGATKALGSHQNAALTACAQDPGSASLRNCGPAPAIAGIERWLNSPPLDLASLRGKVVLVDFWAYSCINCQRAIAHTTAWYSTYKADGLEVIGVHTPEYAFEHTAADVAAPLTPEMYLGSERADYYAGDSPLGSGTKTFAAPSSLPDDAFALGGTWSVGGESLTAGPNAAIALNYDAHDVYLDVGGTGTLTVTEGGKTTTYRVSGAPNIYTVVHHDALKRATLHVTLSPGLKAYSFTYG
jgi:thiol-disulfide isomerase/thioredoxin